VSGHFDLIHDVVLADTDVRWRRGEDMCRLAGWDALQLRDVVLDEEHTTLPEMSGGVSETLDLLVLAGQVRDCVAEEVHEAEAASIDGGRGEVAEGHTDVRGTCLGS
jgi:hypothetical protein